MKSALACLFFLLITPLAFGQEILEFEKITHDFGQVNEEDGPISYSFRFVNRGTESVVITGVKASCGCTTPAWSKEAILPNDSGFVTAQYNPFNRPGNFKKSLRISYKNGGQAAQEVIYIEGEVKPKPKPIEDELPTQIGHLRVKYKSLNIGKITTEKEVVRQFEVYNAGDSTFEWLAEKSAVPAHVAVSFEPTALKSKEKGNIILTYDPNKKGELGFSSDNIRLFTTEDSLSEKEFSVIATVEEYFPPMTEEELKKAPKLSFNSNQYDFGAVNKGNTVKTTFTLTNNGQEDLLIRQVKSNCGCTVANLKKEKIKAGKSVEMEVSFDTTGRRGRQYKTVTIFSNDPTAPTQTLSLKAEIRD